MQSRKSWQTIFVFLFFLLLPFATFAQEMPKSPLLGGMQKPSYPRKARCPACAPFARELNNAAEDLMDQEDYLDDIEADLKRTDRQLTEAENEVKHLKSQFVRHPSASNRTRLDQAEQHRETLNKQYARENRELEQEERYYNEMISHYNELESALKDCEGRFCGRALGNPINQMLFLHYMTNIQFGLLLGNFNNYRSGYIQALSERFSGSNSQNNAMFGPQLRFLFGAPELMHVFVLMNAITFFNASNTFLRARTDSLSSLDSRLKLTNLWMAHLLIGLQSQMYNYFSVSGAVGAAVVDQKLESDIAENVVTSKSTTQTSLAPSAMVSLDYKLCGSCFYGKGLTLSGQVSADYYPSVDNSVTTPLGNNYQNQAQSTWNFAEALVLSMQF